MSTLCLDKRPEKLSPRLAQVALRLPSGKTYAQIARELKLGLETVRSHVDALRDAVGLRHRAQLAVWAAKQEKWLAGRIKERP